MLVQPYLFFDGRCEEALNFYKTAIGAKVTMMMRFSESPVPPSPEMGAGGKGGTPDMRKIMHANMEIGGTQVMASDGMAQGKPEFKGISLSITVTSDAEAQRLFKALGDGGQVQMPMAETFFASTFGMVADRFGVSWMVINPKPQK